MAGLSKNNTRARILLYGAIGVLIARRRKQLYRKKQLKRFWRRGIFYERKLHSEYYHLCQTLRESDREFHYRYVRMSKERFDHILSLIREKIIKKDTSSRLVITLRYLSAGMSQQTLRYSFRVGRTSTNTSTSTSYLRIQTFDFSDLTGRVRNTSS